jgi:hypothetical protein
MDGAYRRDFGIIRRASVDHLVYEVDPRTGDANAKFWLKHGDGPLDYGTIPVANKLAFLKLEDACPAFVRIDIVRGSFRVWDEDMDAWFERAKRVPDTIDGGSESLSDYFNAIDATNENIRVAEVIGLEYVPPEPSRYRGDDYDPAEVILILKINRKKYKFDILENVMEGFDLKRISAAAVKRMEAVMPESLKIELTDESNGKQYYDILDHEILFWIQAAKKKPARKANAKKAPAEKAPAEKAPAKKTTAKKAPAKKTTAKKTTAKKTDTKSTEWGGMMVPRTADPNKPAVESVLQYIADLISENIF